MRRSPPSAPAWWPAIVAAILGSKYTGPPVDPAHAAVALAFLSRCRKTRIVNCHSFDLRRAIGNVSLGSVIAAAVALGFSLGSLFTSACGTHTCPKSNPIALRVTEKPPGKAAFR
jgi:hypothetical protein